MTDTSNRRHAATQRYTDGVAAINTMFDRADNVRTVLGQVQDAARLPDVLAAANRVWQLATELEAASRALAAAARTAGEYRTKAALAADLDIRVGLLFPRTAPAGVPGSPSDPAAAVCSVDTVVGGNTPPSIGVGGAADHRRPPDERPRNDERRMSPR